MRRAIRISLPFLLAACGRQSDRATPKSETASTAPGAQAPAPTPIPPDTTTVAIDTRVCLDSMNEQHALECSHGAARRDSDSLFIRFPTREMKYSDSGGEAPSGYRYVGTIGDSVFHVVLRWGGETYPHWLFVTDRTGSSVAVQKWPLFSPDGTRMASGGDGWDNCAEGGDATMQIWRFTRTVPVEELHLLTQDCYHEETSWGVLDLSWKGNDTLTFNRATMNRKAGKEETRPARAVRVGQTWRIEVDSAAK
jgi:hypothetical protein